MESRLGKYFGRPAVVALFVLLVLLVVPVAYADDTVAGTPVAEAISSLSGVSVVIWGVDPNTQEWEIYDSSPTSPDNLAFLVFGRSYWIYVARSVHLVSDGVSVVLQTGWNLVEWESKSDVSAPQTDYYVSALQRELYDYLLGLINADRVANGLLPVSLGSNPAAQKHADEMFTNDYISHWGLDGMKPYMRYTLEGGYSYSSENAYHQPLTSNTGLDIYGLLDQAELGLMGSAGTRTIYSMSGTRR